MTLTQFLRLLALSSGAAILGLTLAVIHVFVLSYRHRVKVGLLPWHVLGLAAYAINTSVKDTLALIDLLHTDAPLTHFGAMTLAGNGILVASLVSVFILGRRRLYEQGQRPPDHERRWPGRAERTGPPA